MAGDVLSQSEIDALLSALSTGEMSADDIKKEEETKKVKVYDFKRALRFSKDQIRSLTRIHENFARLLTTFFSAQLRTYVQITVASVDQIPFEEFIYKNNRIKIFNEIIKEECKDIPFLDVFDLELKYYDGLHPDSEGYDLMFEKIKQFIEEMI